MATGSSCLSCGSVTFAATTCRNLNNSSKKPSLTVRPARVLGKHSTLQRLFLEKVAKHEAQRAAGVISRSQGPQAVAGQAVAGVKFVTGEEAKKLVEEEGYSLVDIRDQVQYERTRIPTAVHIPYFIRNDDNDIGTIINRQLHNGFSGLFYGLAYTKENPEFISTVTKKFPKDSKLLLVCHEGLRSGFASEKLEKEGYQNLAYLTSGLQKVGPDIFPKEGKVELKDGGKGGLVTIQGPFSLALGAILILAYLYLQFFPEQAEELFFKS